jgi:hypothetical protein
MTAVVVVARDPLDFGHFGRRRLSVDLFELVKSTMPGCRMDWKKALNRSPLHGSLNDNGGNAHFPSRPDRNVLGQEQRLTAPLLSRQQDARRRRRRWWTVTNAAAASGAKRVQYSLGLPLGIPVELLAGQVKGENLLQVILAFMPTLIRASLMERGLRTVARVRQHWDGARFDWTICGCAGAR